MLRPLRINVGKLLDPVKLQQIVKYQGNLTITSNDMNIIPRDDAGNVQLQEDSETNPLLIIEPVATRITLNSVLKVLDTQFQYFKFPATVRVIDTPQVDVDLTIPELQDLPEQDLIYARYKPSEDFRLSDVAFSGILMDEVVDGQPQKNINGYFITKEIKNSGKDLRFFIKLQHKYQADSDGYGTAYFSIVLNSPDRGLKREWKGPYANQSEGNSTWGSIARNEIQTLQFEIIIRNEEFEIGETISIGAKAGKDQNKDSSYHFVIADQSYWVITDASKNVDEWNQEIS
jgi:hypothetical protein